MKVYSLIKNNDEFQLVLVEVCLVAGLPDIQIMGLPDFSIKESQTRIKTAIKSMGYDFPKKNRVLVDLKPSYLKKKSQGLEFAIAIAYLLKTNQLKWPFSSDKVIAYGELSFDGRIICPDDLLGYHTLFDSFVLLTGSGFSKKLAYDVYRVETLKDLSQPSFHKAVAIDSFFKKPELPSFSFTENTLQLMSIIAAGEHNALLAGPAGSGKSTLAKSIYSLLLKPSDSDKKEILMNNHYYGEKAHWRPLVAPHHSTPQIAMVGGGVPPFPGEISRAHKGLLLLDEFLEFKKNVIEALREPIEAGEINVSRLKNNKTFSADFLLLATTNLCPCGKWVPKKIISCQRSLVKCRFYLDKLSGPLLDRFEIVFVVDKQKQGKVQHLLTAEKLVEKATKFRLDTRKQIKVNSRLSLKELIMMIDSTELQAYMPENFNSQRRQRSTLSVARTIADLDESLEIKNYHMTEAMKLTYFPHKGFDEIY